MRTWLPALLIGLATGYAALELREMGWIIAAGVLILLPVVYFRQRRLADIGWLFFGAGLAPSFFLGRTLVETFTDPAVHVLADTWVFFAVGVVLAGAGIAIVAAAARKQPTAS